MTIFDWFMGRYGRRSIRTERVSDIAGIDTVRILAILLNLVLWAFCIIAVYAVVIGWSNVTAGARFLIWAWLTGMAAWLAGILLGLLFGLPLVAEVRISGPQGDGVAAPLTPGMSGYRENTNLEQIADWITKILIGLTLTQYQTWEMALDRAFQRAASQMYADPAAPGTSAAIITIALAANGFLAAYLVMRRYFITEMVKGRGEADAAAAEAIKKIELARKAGLLQDASVTRSMTGAATSAVRIATVAANLAPAQSVAEANTIAQEVRNNVGYPDDPWRGKFDGTNVAGGCRLAASVAALDGSNELFTVRLSLTAEPPESRAGQSATYYLHPTFGTEPKKVAFGQDGTANLELIAYGAFTVGVLLETGERLELNLATLEGAPDLFKLR